MSENGPVAALWIWRRGNLTYQLYDTEAETIEAAFYADDYDDQWVEGVQFSDGRLIKTEDWEALQEYSRATRAEQAARAAEFKETYVPKPTRQIADPFGSGETMTVDAEEPLWLGKA